MCGIVAIISNSESQQEVSVSERLVDALKRLEYRGYDSAGVATLLGNGEIDRRRAEGKIVNLEKRIKEEPLEGHIGIAHTRWATHGRPNENNAHPHATDEVAIVHNGIIENYQELKAELEKSQFSFKTETDSEIVAQLITYYRRQGMEPLEASRTAFSRLEGAYAIAAIFKKHDNLLIGVRKGTPLAVGYGTDGEMYLASDSYALAPLTNKICFLEDGDHVVLQDGKAQIYANDNSEIERPIKISKVSGAMLGKGEYKHYMLKEIYEQPAVIAETLSTYINPNTARITLPESDFDLSKASRFTITACGTAYLAGMVMKYWLEQLADMPVELDIASEFRYRKGPMLKNGVTLVISQSGETLDTLEAMRYAKSKGQFIMSVVNTQESTIERESDFVLHTKAGPEIGVASTKAFTTQLSTLACLAFDIARARGTMDAKSLEKMALSLRELPARVADILGHDEDLQEIAKDIEHARDVLYLGRGLSYPIALEGALKLKEISYIHAEGYAAGEMKHGPIALIDENVPVIVVAPYDELFEKTAGNIQEVAARGGKVLLLSSKEGCDKLKDHVEWSVALPKVNETLSPILYSLPIQLLAYHVAKLKGTDIDQPRNLAKAVTVE
ncbi:MAG: glutamine--fructose-6-phosphate transaminase (isomerizing) [Rickettsiales bacterium]|nr:glutamine--fructose-6-phosphate transaminase (isomerizing) [Rickettsiales bacterium]